MHPPGPVDTADLPGGGTAAQIAAGVFNNASAVPGGYDGDARFIRMAILKSAAYYKRCWPDPRFSPASPQTRRPGYPELLPSMLTAKAIIDSVALPLGMTDFVRAYKLSTLRLVKDDVHVVARCCGGMPRCTALSGVSLDHI